MSLELFHAIELIFFGYVVRVSDFLVFSARSVVGMYMVYSISSSMTCGNFSHQSALFLLFFDFDQIGYLATDNYFEIFVSLHHVLIIFVKMNPKTTF